MIIGIHRYGWIPDVPDQRDRPYALLAAVLPPLPPRVDLRGDCTPIEDQGILGSCTAQALVGNMEVLKKQALQRTINFSRLFLYYNERVLEHTVRSDAGAQLRNGIKTLVTLGDCLETDWPYTIRLFAKKPSIAAYKNSASYQITAYFRLTALSEMKHTLARGFPFVFGFAVYEGLETEEVAKTGIIPMPGISERMIGGHAVMAVGYDDDTQMLLIRNSWGKRWGDKGYGYMPYAYVQSRNLSDDFWTIRDME